MLKIRLRRTGARKRPNYRVVVAEATTPRDGQFIEIIGFYDPLTDPATVRIDADKARRWIRQGAKPTDRVARLLAREGITEARPTPAPETAPARGQSAAVAEEAAPATEATEGDVVGAGEAGATTEVPADAEAETASA